MLHIIRIVRCSALCVALQVACGPLLLSAQRTAAPADTVHSLPCPNCAEWNAPQAPFKIFGDTYYVGTHGLGSILIVSPGGDVLIDGGIPESAELILQHIQQLGFPVRDIKLILNSHDHFDHAGGIAALQAASHAGVAASPLSAHVLRAGKSFRDDPQFGIVSTFPAVKRVRVIADRETIRVGTTSITAHFTPGHTPGGTSWTWQSCDSGRCVNIVYADSQTAVSADGFLFSRNTVYPNAVADFEHSFTVLESLPCDILLTPHPDASMLWQRVAARDSGRVDGLVDTNACKRYAANARVRLQERVEKEQRP